MVSNEEATDTAPPDAKDVKDKGGSSAPDSAEKTDGAAAGRSRRRYRGPSRRGDCRFCRDKVKHVDYKDVTVLRALLRGRGRLMSRQRSGNCARHQHMVKKAVKRARFIGLLGYDEGPPRGGRAAGSW